MLNIPESAFIAYFRHFDSILIFKRMFLLVEDFVYFLLRMMKTFHNDDDDDDKLSAWLLDATLHVMA